MEMQLITIEEKLDIVIQELIELRKRLDNVNHQSRDNPLSIKQAAEYLKLSVSRLYYLVSSGELIPQQRNKKGRILFSIEELKSYLKKNNK